MEKLLAISEDAFLDLRTSAPPELFSHLPQNRFKITPVTLDCGTIDTPDWDVDQDATMNAVCRIAETRKDLVEGELDQLSGDRPDVIVFDVPWLAPVIARKAEVPSLAIANFTWDQIYRAYIRNAADADIIRSIHEDYLDSTLALRTPLSPHLRSFNRVENIPLIARSARGNPIKTREELGLGENDKAILVALNKGLGPLESSDWLPSFVTLGFTPLARPNHKVLPASWRDRFPDLVAASDIVLSKPGYGIVGECITNKTPLLHLPRLNFHETMFLINDLEKMGKHLPVRMDELSSPGFELRLDRWLERSSNTPWPRVLHHGATVAAQRILALANGS